MLADRGGSQGQRARGAAQSASAGGLSGWREQLSAFSLIFTALFLSHITLLRLPYFWDEAGYFIPAARDLLLNGSLIPHTTLSNAHPPLVMIWLALWWKFSAFTPAATRTAMLLISAFALLGLFRLAQRVANLQVAIASVVCTALYPVFFAQSSLANLDLTVCALTLWGLAMYVEGRLAAAVVFFSLAPLAKETAIVAPLALFGWELLCPLAGKSWTGREALCSPGRSRVSSLAWLLCAVPLAIWFVYHHHRTGFYVGNPEYLRYNLGATITPLRVGLALLIRLWQLLGYLNLFLLTMAAAYAMTRPALREKDGSLRQRIAIPVQLVFLVVVLSYLAMLSLLGGAVLARYLLPVVPLVILICVSTLRRRFRRWILWIVVTCASFLLALFVPPPYRVAPEDTLLYRDFVVLHKLAADELSQRHPGARILTAWPASDELSRPFLGYVKQPLAVIPIENFSESEMLRAAQQRDRFDYVLLFSTKWVPPHPLLKSLPFGKALHEKFFDYHEDVSPQRAAEMLDVRVTRYWERNNEWVALIAIENVQNASLRSLSSRR